MCKPEYAPESVDGSIETMATAGMAGTHVQLRRDLASPSFESWRLAGGSLPARVAIDLPGSVCRHEPQTYDFLSARISALRSHLYVHGDQLWAFVQGMQGLQLCGFAARDEAYMMTHTVGPDSLCFSPCWDLLTHRFN